LQQAADGASLVVSRCGYNTAYALLRTPLPIVFCPYAESGSDQIERAAALGQLDGVWDFDEKAGATSLVALIDEALGARTTGRAASLDCDGAERAAQVLASLAKRRITL
jgi:predicted glycosyltransferase